LRRGPVICIVIVGRGNSVGLYALCGAAESRGLSAVFVVCGLVGATPSLAALAHARFRNIDSLVPDER